MIVKNTLEEYRENTRRLIFLEKELNFLNKETKDIEAVQLSEKTGPTNKVSNVIEKSYIKKESDLEKILLEKAYLNHLIDLSEFFISIADTEEEQELLREKYFYGITFSKLAKKLNLSESGVRMKAERAINKIAKTIDLNNMKYEREIGA